MFFLLTILVGLMAVGAVVLGFRDQRALWWRLRARWYANPEANEPSDAAFAVQRVGWFAAAAALAFGAFQIYGLADSVSWSGGEVRNAAEQAARALAADDDGVLIDPTMKEGDFFLEEVEDKVRHTAEADKNGFLTVSRNESKEDPVDLRRSEKIVERYTISDKGSRPVCMTVTGKRTGKFSFFVPGGRSSGIPPTYHWKLSAAVADGTC